MNMLYMESVAEAEREARQALMDEQAKVDLGLAALLMAWPQFWSWHTGQWELANLDLHWP